jgi:hypothetical protein
MILGGARHACGKSNDSLLHVAQLPHGTVRIKPQNAVNDMIGSGLIRWVQVARLCSRLEGSHDDPLPGPAANKGPVDSGIEIGTTGSPAMD